MTRSKTMAQTLIALDTPPAGAKTGFDIGWDHARHGLLPPPEHWREGSALQQGWRAGKACFGTRTLAASPRVRRWLALRISAWRRGIAFETLQVTPHYLGQVEAPLCPVTRRPLGAAEASLDRVNDAAGYAAGNLATLSREANRAKAALGWADALQRAHLAGAEGGVIDGLDAAAWARLATLISFVTPLPLEQAARLPLRVLPPNRLRLLNPVQGLQALVTRELARPDGTRRLRELAALLHGEALRADFHRLLAALLPRRLQAGQQADGWALRHALEDAWSDALVNRCWQRFALQLDDALIERLLQRCAAGALAGTRWLLHDFAAAIDGWALDSGGRVPAARSHHAAPPRGEGARIAPLRTRVADGHLPA
jgi:hypothetical protein